MVATLLLNGALSWGLLATGVRVGGSMSSAGTVVVGAAVLSLVGMIGAIIVLGRLLAGRGPGVLALVVAVFWLVLPAAGVLVFAGGVPFVLDY